MAIYSSLNEEYFDGSLSVDITWGRRQTRGVYRKRRLGSYDAAGSLIRIHPALDKPAVPRFFIEYIVYHEMLHAAIGIRVKTADAQYTAGILNSERGCSGTTAGRWTF